ncbi:MAG: Omp28-related outer membrane protein [Bacteroidales bacterium]|nr:Omp28-related outer membrane protein [Bacteroidales bacterium]
MKNIKTIMAFLSAVVIMSSCGEDVVEVGGMGVKMDGVVLTFDKSVIQADGSDAVSFKVYYQGSDVTGQATVFKVDGSKYEQTGSVFSTDQVGNYSFQAAYKAGKSDFVAINAISRSIPSAAKDNEPSNTSFVRRTFFNQHTGADCPNCPFMTYLIKRTLNDEVKDKVVLASVRNYAGEVDFANVPNPVSSWPYLHIDYDTTYPYNGTVDGLQSKIDEWTSAPAKVGISANPMYYEDGQIIVKVSVKAAETDEYNVGLWLMQDNIYIKQQVASDRLHLLDGTWGDEYHYHNNCVRIAESRYLGSHVGYPLGKIEAGKTAEWIFLINANIGQKDLNGDGRCDVGDSWWYTKGKINLDDLHFAAFVTTHKGTVYKVANVIDFKYNETKPFEYIK